MEEQQKDVDRRQLADTEQINEINWSSSTVVWDNKERYNNIDDLNKQEHNIKRELVQRKQCNLSPRNCDDSESIQDVDFDKIESQVIKVCTITAAVFHLIIQFTNQRNMNCILCFPNTYSLLGAANCEEPNGFGSCICLRNPIILANVS